MFQRYMWAVLTSLLISIPVLGDGFIHIVPHPGQPSVIPLGMNYHKVEVQVDNQVATTRVDEEFFNPNPRDLEGTYMFPVPKGATIDKFSMFIDGKETAAELLDAAKARTIYEDIVRKMRDPALLEYADRDLFKVRVYPIPARGTKRVKLSYNEVLKNDAGLCRYVYPLNIEKFSSSPIKTLSFKMILKSKFPIKNVYCPTHQVEISRKGDHEAVIGFEASYIRPDRDVEIIYTVDDKDVGINLLTYKPAGEDGFFLCLLAPKFEVPKGREVPKDVCFVVDTSGSMADNGKLDQAKKALEFCLRNLGDADRFNIVRFSTEADVLYDKLVRFGEHIDPTMDFVRKLKPLGGTNIHDALVRALKLKSDQSRPYLVVFLTDGLPTVGETHPDRILAKVQSANQAATRIFCFGVGYDVNVKLLDRVSETTRAASQYVKPDEDLEVKVSDFFTKIKDPVLSQVALYFDGIKVRDVYPRVLPDLFRGSQLVVAGRFEGQGKTAVRLEGLVDGKKQTFTRQEDFSGSSDAYEFIPRLWANQKVAFLLDEIRLHGENKELVTEATQLAKQYGIITPYTSYLILEDERIRPAAGPVPQISRRLKGDAPAESKAYRYSRENYLGLTRSDKGRGAVSANQSVDAMKMGQNLAAGPGLGFTAEPEQAGITDLTQNVRNVADRTFVMNAANQWVDTRIANLKNPKKVVVNYLSDEYFKLLREKPQIGKFLALGEGVIVYFDGVVYEVKK